MTITNGVSNNAYHRSASIATAHDALVSFTFAVTTGGSVSVPRAGIRLYTTDGTDEWQIYVSASTGGYTVYDVNGATFDVNIAPDMTEPRQILVWMSGDGSGSIVVADREVDSRTWTVRLDSTLTSTTGTTGYLDWGNIFGSSSTVSEWLNLTYVVSVASAVGTLRPRLDTTTKPTLRGMPMPSAPVMIPDAGSSTGASYISVEGGPGRFGESWEIAREYDYPARNMFTEVSPSPSKVWRPASTGSTSWVWSFDEETPITDSGSVFIYSVGSISPRLDGWNGTSWEIIATTAGVDLSVDLVGSGDTLSPAGVGGERYLFKDELKGGLCHTLSARANILGNSAGVLTTAGTNRKATIRTDRDLDGVSVDAIYWPRKLTIAHNVGAYSRYRLFIAANESSAGVNNEAGTIMIGAFVPFGQRPSLSGSTSLQSNTTDRTTRYGTSYRRQEGPPRRSVSMQWSDPLDLYQMRGASPDPDYIAADSGNPLATWQDVPYWLHATFEELRSGEVPCVLVTNVPGTDATITDPTQFVYGRLTRVGDLTLRLGQEGETEVIGVGTTIIEEIK